MNTELKSIQDQLNHTNGAVQDNKAYEVQILNLNNELSFVKNELNSVRTELQVTENKYKRDLDHYVKVRDAMQQELEERKVKNDVSFFLNLVEHPVSYY